MSKENFTKFYEEYVPKHATLKAQLDSIHNEEEFTKIAMAEGPKGGFTFAAADIAAVMETHKPKRKAQLSEKELDGVAGGAKATLTHKEGTVMCCW